MFIHGKKYDIVYDQRPQPGGEQCLDLSSYVILEVSW